MRVLSSAKLEPWRGSRCVSISDPAKPSVTASLAAVLGNDQTGHDSSTSAGR
jgi:hypothetical protein